MSEGNTPQANGVLGAIQARPAGEPFSASRLARQTGYTTRSVQRALAELRRKGEVLPVKGEGTEPAAPSAQQRICDCPHSADKHDSRGCTGTYLELTKVGMQKRPCACPLRRFVASSPAAGDEVAR